MQPVTNIPVITIDGPSGVGKGTLARHLAHKLGWHILDSGAIYRLLALHAQKQQLKSSDTAALAASAAHLDIDCRIQDKQIIYLLHQEDVSADIRTEACAGFASEIARIAELRQLLLAKQRAFKRPPGLVADGRDMGTVVFPEAVYKIFLTASPAERARRRYRELQQSIEQEPLIDGVAPSILFPIIIRNRTTGQGERVRTSDVHVLDSSWLSVHVKTATRWC